MAIQEGALYKGLREATSKYRGNGISTSYYDQFRNMRGGMDYLNDLYAAGEFDATNGGLYNQAADALKAGQTAAVFGGVYSAAEGIAGIGQAAAANIRTNDTTPYYNRYGMLNAIAGDGYTNPDQIHEDYRSINNLSRKNYDFDDINGKTTWQKLGNVGSSVLSGATAGLTIGGPWGAAIGAGVGLLAGAGSWALGDYRAKLQENNLASVGRVKAADAAKQANRSYENWNANNYNFRYGHSLSEGGKIDRKNLTIKEFADRVLNNSKTGTTHSAGIMRSHCKGGTMIRIKVK